MHALAGSILGGIQHPDGFAEAAAQKLITLSTESVESGSKPWIAVAIPNS